MTKVNYKKDKMTYFSILASDGKFHQVVTENTLGAVRRDYETSDGKTGVKWELIADSIEGKITALGIYEGDYGKNILIGLGEGDEEVTISLSSSQNFGEDFMKKLPNIEVEKEVILTPYSFEDSNGKLQRGISIKQHDEKILNHYSSYNEKKKKWESVKGFPTPEGDTKKFDSDDWKAYFIKARKYLLSEFEKHPLFMEEFITTEVVAIDENSDSISPKDINF